MDVDGLLSSATECIGKNYFQLPIDGQDVPIYRERVYCYELYHQMRLAWPEDSEFELSGEVDKSGHPLIRGNNLDRVKPDLLIHIPGNMGGNHTVIEVKPINCSRAGISKDLSTLTAFRRYAEYKRAVYLFYGDGDLSDIIEKAKEIEFGDRENRIELGLIEFWWHRRVGEPATRYMQAA